MKRSGLLTSGIACLALSCVAVAQLKFRDVQTSVQAAYALHSSEDKALGYGANSHRLETYRLQHEHDYRLGSNFLLYDRLHSDEPLGGPVFGPHNPAAFAYGPGNSTYFMVLGAELHASKVLGIESSTGLFKDWGVSGRLERGGYYQFKAEEIGPQLHFNIPGFDRFRVTLWRRWKSDTSGSAGQGGFDVGNQADYRPSWLAGVDWRTSWQMLGFTWTSQAFIRYQMGDGGKADAHGSENINGIPARVWIEPDIFMNVNKYVAVGFRDYYLWQGDAINNGYSTAGQNSHHVPQVVLRLNLNF